LQMNLYKSDEPVFTNLIDTVGFQIFRSRRVVNTGHGEEDRGQYQSCEIFGVEGVVPIFRRKALEDCRIYGNIIDPDFRRGPLGYGDDFDLAWRMRLFGWKEYLSPGVLAYHDRSTTKDAAPAKFFWWKHISRIGKRRTIPIEKRRLDWRNVRFTIIKNDYIINLLKDAPQLLWREIKVLGYTLLFEPRVLAEMPKFLYLLPTMLRNRRLIMKKAKVGPNEIHKWFI